MKNATTICIYLFCLLMAGELQAWTFSIDTDSRLRFKYINEENGLTQNSATSILQDKNGLLLFSIHHSQVLPYNLKGPPKVHLQMEKVILPFKL